MRVVGQILEFRRRLRERVAERVEQADGGVGLFVDSAPGVYDANYVLVERATDAEAHAALAERLMPRFHHRRVISDAGGADVAPAFARLGWEVATHVVMAARRPPDRTVDTSAVREVPFEALVAARRSLTLAEPWGDDALGRELDEVKRRVAAAVPVRFFAAFHGDEVAAYCELRAAADVAQIEDVNTLPPFRGRGLGRMIVQHALEEARREAPIVFLDAIADDWPRRLYAKLGFDVVDERHLFLRPPHPLTRIALRTPRLALRLATVAELQQLAGVARAGVVDGDAMPFEVAWTDSANEPSFVADFVAYHQEALRGSTPRRWRLELVAFRDGRSVGVQGIGAERFHSMRTVSTGSWLGRRYQGQGLGTEMRAAVLALAFDVLGARVAVSGAHPENASSLGVSRKLGYEPAGTKVAHPRGKPVTHRLLRLERTRFASPVEVDLHVPADVLPLLGAR